jgi:hypothetical protein
MARTAIEVRTTDLVSLSSSLPRRKEPARRKEKVMFTRSIPAHLTAAARRLAVAALAGALLLGATSLAAPEAAAQFDEICTNRGDNDGDGMGSYAECNFGTDPRDPDTDNDGTSDPDEIFVHDTDPRNVDTDGDALSDTYEIGTQPGPLVNNNAPPAPAPVDPAPAPDLCQAPQAGVDSDGDGMFDADECGYFGTLPNDADTDNDGSIDGAEDENGTNPNDPNDF